MNTIEIPLSKNKIMFLMIGSLIFVLIGGWFFSGYFSIQTPFSPVIIQIVGLISILFFGGTLFFSLKKYLEKKPGLIINDNGILDNSSSVSIGLIEWDDISGIRFEQIISTRFLLIDTKNPDKYISKATGMKAKIMRTNYNMYGSPISIASTSLKIDFDDLAELLKSEFRKSRQMKYNRII